MNIIPQTYGIDIILESALYYFFMPSGIKLTPNDVRESNMKLYADPITVNCRKVLAGFKLMGIPYERIHVDYFK